MTPDTLRIDKRVKGVGRIAIASGTTHRPTFRRILDMIDGLRERGRYDILRAIRDHKLTPLQVLDAWRVNDLDSLPSPDELTPLATSLDTFVRDYECSEKHRASLKSSAKHLKEAVPTSATVADLPSAVRALRESMKGTPRAFNLTRAAALAFARSHSGRASRLWLEVQKVELRKVKAKRAKHPLTVAEVAAIEDYLPAHLRFMAWSLAQTGMRPKEYWSGAWECRHGEHVRITGTKTKSAVRRVPDIGPMTTPTCWYGKFRKELQTAADKAGLGIVTPYDLRRTYAGWLEEAGIPRTRRRLYMGHGVKDVTDLYEEREVRAFLVEDGQKLSAYIAGELAKADPKPARIAGTIP